MTLLARVAREKRAWWVPVAVLAIGNVALFALVIVPLRARVATLEGRARDAAASVRAATAQVEQAEQLVAGKTRALEQLERFYQQVLPANQSSARRLTYLDLARLARAANLRVLRRTQSIAEERGSTLLRLDTSMVLEGRYADVRAFLHDLETASDFVIVDNLSLMQSTREDGTLVLTLALSTYYRGNHAR